MWILLSADITYLQEGEASGLITRDVIEFGRLAAGEFDFNGQATNDSLVDFMLGLPSVFYQGNMQRYDGRQNYYGAYVHDVFQVTKKVTAQLGRERWEPNLWGQESDMQMQHFNMAAFSAGTISNAYHNAPAGLLFSGDAGAQPEFSENHPWKFEPRAGLAWDPTGSGRQVIRAGYGLFR